VWSPLRVGRPNPVVSSAPHPLAHVAPFQHPGLAFGDAITGDVRPAGFGGRDCLGWILCGASFDRGHDAPPLGQVRSVAQSEPFGPGESYRGIRTQSISGFPDTCYHISLRSFGISRSCRARVDYPRRTQSLSQRTRGNFVLLEASFVPFVVTCLKQRLSGRFMHGGHPGDGGARGGRRVGAAGGLSH
jgi:hypothetical protein